MDIPGIPESIPRPRILEMVGELGLDPRDLRSLTINAYSLEAEMYARNEDGSRYSDDGENNAVHRIAIPITDQMDTTEIGQKVVDAVRDHERRHGPLR